MSIRSMALILRTMSYLSAAWDSFCKSDVLLACCILVAELCSLVTLTSALFDCVTSSLLYRYHEVSSAMITCTYMLCCAN